MTPALTLPVPAPAGSRRRRADVAVLPLHLAATGLVALAGLTAIGLRLYESPGSHNPIAIATGLTAIGLIAYARYFLRLPWMSAPVVYLLLFWMFHFGMTFTVVLVPSLLTPLADWEIEWFYWSSVRIAMILGVIGAAGFVFGAGIFGMHDRTQRPETSVREHESALYGTGWLLMLAGLAGTAAIFARAGGFGVFSYSYLDFRSEVLGPTYLQSTMYLSQLGCLFAICGAGGRRWVTPLAVWFVFGAGVFFLLGMRGEAMTPLVTFAAVLTSRGVRWRKSTVIAAVLIASLAIPAIQVIRVVGVQNRSLVNWTEVTPLDTLIELGSSLRATRAHVDWIGQGDEYLLGASYWAPLDRQVLVRVVPGREQIPWFEDERVPGRLMEQREGPFGGSATGEAYYNFGPAGPFIYFSCVGLFFIWLERRAGATPYRCAFLGAAMLIFIPNIRGEWLAMPANMALSGALVACCYVLARLFNARTVSVDECSVVANRVTAYRGHRG